MRRGVSMTVVKGNELPAYIDGGKVVSCLGEPDFILYLDKDVHAAQLLEKAGFRLFNRAATVRLCDDKMLTYAALANEGFLIPKTISSPLMYRSFPDRFYERVEAEIPYPVVVKNVFGSMGRGVYLAETGKSSSASARNSSCCRISTSGASGRITGWISASWSSAAKRSPPCGGKISRISAPISSWEEPELPARSPMRSGAPRNARRRCWARITAAWISFRTAKKLPLRGQLQRLFPRHHARDGCRYRGALRRLYRKMRLRRITDLFSERI